MYGVVSSSRHRLDTMPFDLVGRMLCPYRIATAFDGWMQPSGPSVPATGTQSSTDSDMPAFANLSSSASELNSEQSMVDETRPYSTSELESPTPHQPTWNQLAWISLPASEVINQQTANADRSHNMVTSSDGLVFRDVLSHDIPASSSQQDGSSQTPSVERMDFEALRRAGPLALARDDRSLMADQPPGLSNLVLKISRLSSSLGQR